jgi:manganese/zinc/iron transport system ATP- binding protein
MTPIIPAVTIQDLTVAYRDSPVLWDIDVTIPVGVMMAIVGPNGAGKTTLLKSVLGLIRPASGNILILGKPYAQQRRQVGYVPQRNSVDWDFPTSAWDVVTMGRYGHLGWIRRPSKADRQLAMDALEKVGMADFANRQINQLSGGQQQRVFLARALVQAADIYFLDEPFAGVDAATEAAIVLVLKELKRQGKTLIVVHHDLQTLKEYFDWILMLNVHLVGCGPIDTVLTEANLKIAYGGRTAFIPYA